MLFALCSCGNSKAIDDTDANLPTASQNEKINVDSTHFTEVSLNDIYQVYSKNRLKAEKTYIGKYVEVTASVFSIHDNSISLNEYQYSNGIKTGYDSAWCYIKDDSLEDIMLDLEVEDIITVKGKITSLTSTGTFLVSIDIYAIE